MILHNCLIQNESYDLLIAPHTPTKRYIRSKRQTTKKTIIAKPQQTIRRRFSKIRNAVSESDTTTIQELQDLKDSIDRNNPKNEQKYFSDSESTSPSSIKGKRRVKIYINTHKPVRLYNWNQPKIHIENYTSTVLQ